MQTKAVRGDIVVVAAADVRAEAGREIAFTKVLLITRACTLPLLPPVEIAAPPAPATSSRRNRLSCTARLTAALPVVLIWTPLAKRRGGLVANAAGSTRLRRKTMSQGPTPPTLANHARWKD
ncbi:MAG: hypothetical protein IPO66_23225 [Rhodanobacteraceae bacterium]|nr:hypothetical protein [Rhodanobacteraceae bacterium]